MNYQNEISIGSGNGLALNIGDSPLPEPIMTKIVVTINIAWAIYRIICTYIYGADSRFAPGQWETALLYNDVSHWPLGANLASALHLSMWGLWRTKHVDDVGQGCYGGSHSHKRHSQGDGPTQLRRAQGGRLGRFINHCC